jgi:hypothetical protein
MVAIERLLQWAARASKASTEDHDIDGLSVGPELLLRACIEEREERGAAWADFWTGMC